MKIDWLKAKKILRKDGVVILPTDTLYGIIGSALSKKAVEKIYKIKGRNKNKPFIILINSYQQLDIFGIKINKEQAKILKKFWPGKVSIILPCRSKKWSYLHRGVESIAFRMIGPRNKNLFNLIEKIGPVVAPSVNLEGQKPAETIGQARKYFESLVDLYINCGTKKSKPSTLISFADGKIKILRN